MKIIASTLTVILLSACSNDEALPPLKLNTTTDQRQAEKPLIATVEAPVAIDEKGVLINNGMELLLPPGEALPPSTYDGFKVTAAPNQVAGGYNETMLSEALSASSLGFSSQDLYQAKLRQGISLLHADSFRDLLPSKKLLELDEIIRGKSADGIFDISELIRNLFEKNKIQKKQFDSLLEFNSIDSNRSFIFDFSSSLLDNKDLISAIEFSQGAPLDWRDKVIYAIASRTGLEQQESIIFQGLFAIAATFNPEISKYVDRANVIGKIVARARVRLGTQKMSDKDIYQLLLDSTKITQSEEVTNAIFSVALKEKIKQFRIKVNDAG